MDDYAYVDQLGIIEVRTLSEYDEDPDDRMDLFKLQDINPAGLSYDYCKRDKYSGIQHYFYCLVCAAELKSVQSMEAHIGGNKHVRKVNEKKKSTLGLPSTPVSQPQQKDIKKPEAVKNPFEPLKDKLESTVDPIIGLEYITEFLPESASEKRRKHPMYSCSLKGCKSAWGTSDDMLNHLKKNKHQKNYLLSLSPDDPRIGNLNKGEVLNRAFEVETEKGGAENRDYNLIIVVENNKQFDEIYNRPNDWSEKKAKRQSAGESSKFNGMNPNLVPLGSRKAVPKADEEKDAAMSYQAEPRDKEYIEVEAISLVRGTLEQLDKNVAALKEHKSESLVRLTILGFVQAKMANLQLDPKKKPVQTLEMEVQRTRDNLVPLLSEDEANVLKVYEDLSAMEIKPAQYADIEFIEKLAETCIPEFTAEEKRIKKRIKAVKEKLKETEKSSAESENLTKFMENLAEFISSTLYDLCRKYDVRVAEDELKDLAKEVCSKIRNGEEKKCREDRIPLENLRFTSAIQYNAKDYVTSKFKRRFL